MTPQVYTLTAPDTQLRIMIGELLITIAHLEAQKAELVALNAKMAADLAAAALQGQAP